MTLYIHMKRYIRSIFATADVDIDTSMFTGTPFVCDTDTSYYNDFLNEEDLKYMQTAKNRDGNIVMMSPEEYFEACGKHGFYHEVSVDDLKAQRGADTESIEWLTNYIEQGNKFYLTYINYADHTQEGLHRMMVLGDLYGWDKQYPVLIVTAYDDEVERQNIVFKEYLNFRDYYFNKICENSAVELQDWSSPPPANYPELLRDEIIKEAQEFDDEEVYDIDVRVEIEEVEEEGEQPTAMVYITRFKAYDCADRYDGHRLWLENYFDFD